MYLYQAAFPHLYYCSLSIFLNTIFLSPVLCTFGRFSQQLTALAGSPMHGLQSVPHPVSRLCQLALVSVGTAVAAAQGLVLDACAHGLGGVSWGQIGTGPALEVLAARAVPPVPGKKKGGRIT